MGGLHQEHSCSEVTVLNIASQCLPACEVNDSDQANN